MLFNRTPSYVVGSMITSRSADGGNWGMERLPKVMDQLVLGNAGSQTQGVWLQNLHSSHIPCPLVWIHVRICLYSHELSLVVHVRKVWEGVFHCMPFLYICLSDHVTYYLLMHLKQINFWLGAKFRGADILHRTQVP